jgi:hypothetical protein
MGNAVVRTLTRKAAGKDIKTARSHERQIVEAGYEKSDEAKQQIQQQQEQGEQSSDPVESAQGVGQKLEAHLLRGE